MVVASGWLFVCSGGGTGLVPRSFLRPTAAADASISRDLPPQQPASTVSPLPSGSESRCGGGGEGGGGEGEGGGGEGELGGGEGGGAEGEGGGGEGEGGEGAGGGGEGEGEGEGGGQRQLSRVPSSELGRRGGSLSRGGSRPDSTGSSTGSSKLRGSRPGSGSKLRGTGNRSRELAAAPAAAPASAAAEPAPPPKKVSGIVAGKPAHPSLHVVSDDIDQ